MSIKSNLQEQSPDAKSFDADVDHEIKTIHDPGRKLPIIKTPYQGLNTILGGVDDTETCGLRRGEFVMVVGFDFNYKVGLLQDLHLGHRLYNKPVMIDSNAKPLLLNIVVNESLTNNMDSMYARYIQHVSCPKDNKLFATGFEFSTVHVNDRNTYTIHSLFDYVIQLESEGYELHQIVFEDLSLISNLDKDGNTMSIADMCIELRVFFQKRGTLAIFTLPVNEELKAVRCQKPYTYLCDVARTGLYGNERRISMSVDCEIYVALHADNLVMYVGKHRGFMKKPNHLVMYPFIDNNSPLYDFDQENRAINLAVDFETSQWYL